MRAKLSARSRRRRPTLGDRTSDRANNFDVLRLAAALLVLVSHSFALTGRPEPGTSVGLTFGGIGVAIFFAISGLLIHRSWVNDPHLASFWRKRALRLFPGLFVMALLTTIVLGPVVTERSLGSYFGDPETWIYPVRITALMPFSAHLPGVFVDNPLPDAVNGSLWSLPIEVAAYGLLALVGAVGLIRSRVAVVVIALLALAGQTVLVLINSPFDAVGVIAAFAVGAAAYSLRKHISIDPYIALAMVGLAAVTANTDFQPFVWTLAIAYITWFLAYGVRPTLGWLTRFGDASYGIYIYAFPVQQTLVWAFDGDIGPWAVVALATPIVWFLGLVSWRLVERPALRWKPRPSAAPAATAPLLPELAPRVPSRSET